MERQRLQGSQWLKVIWCVIEVKEGEGERLQRIYERERGGVITENIRERERERVIKENIGERE